MSQEETKKGTSKQEPPEQGVETGEGWDGKSRGGVLGYQVFAGFLRLFGLRFAYILLLFIVPYFLLFSPKSTRLSYLYFRKIHRLNQVRSVFHVFRHFNCFAQTLVDRLAFYFLPQGKYTYTEVGEKDLKKMATQSGGILVSAHLGNPNIAGHLLENVHKKVNLVMLENDMEQIKKFYDQVSKTRTFEVIPLKKDLSHVYAISAALQNKEIVCLHGDRLMEGVRRVKVTMMGREVELPVGPFEIAAATKAPMSFVFAMKSGHTRYSFFATPPKVYAYTDRKEKQRDLEKWAKEYAKEIEKKIIEYPTQWFNFYNYWGF